jgi:5-methylcytosine-specific restriction endonuclease McrA
MTWKKRDYQDPHYKEFRYKVLKRDKHTCQMCKSRIRKNLEVHHVMTWASASSLRYDVDNGITLCKQCHKSITGQEVHYQSYFLALIKKNGK